MALGDNKLASLLCASLDSSRSTERDKLSRHEKMADQNSPARKGVWLKVDMGSLS